MVAVPAPKLGLSCDSASEPLKKCFVIERKRSGPASGAFHELGEQQFTLQDGPHPGDAGQRCTIPNGYTIALYPIDTVIQSACYFVHAMYSVLRMDLRSIINSLRRESDSLGEVILAMERLLESRRTPAPPDSSAKRRGRPPGSKNRSELAEVLRKAERSREIN
jgi:hypothetical protein